MKQKVEDIEIISYIDNYIIEHGYAPSYREIGNAIGLSSTASVYSRIRGLFDNGQLETDVYNAPRAIRSPRIKFVRVNKNEMESI